MKKGLLLGATGLIGHQLLTMLLEDDTYDQVNVFVRNRVQSEHPKLQQIVLSDFQQFPQYKEAFLVDDVFCCLGTTIKKAKTKENFKRVDFHFPWLAAQLAKEMEVQRFLLISAAGANVRSRFFYNQVKGEAERVIAQLQLPSFYIFRPSLLLGPRKEFRLGEKLSAIISQPLSFVIPDRYRPIQAKDVAIVMHQMAQSFLPGTQIFENDQLHKIVRKEGIR